MFRDTYSGFGFQCWGAMFEVQGLWLVVEGFKYLGCRSDGFSSRGSSLGFRA